VHATLAAWIAREAMPFSVDSLSSFNAAVDYVIASLGDSVDLLAFGEALHYGEDILILRNRLFQRLVEAHGYSALAIEGSVLRAHLVNEYVAGRGPAAYAAVQDSGFSWGHGQFDANRELVEWMRSYNADPSRRVTLQFYGFDVMSALTGTDSPRHSLHVVLDYLTSPDPASDQMRRQRIDTLLGADADWGDLDAVLDPTQARERSEAVTELRIVTDDLLTELQIRRPEFIRRRDADRYAEAVHHASVARQVLNLHAAWARESNEGLDEVSGIRDAGMADNLAYAVSRERGRGKVLAFAHNAHVQRGQIQNVWDGRLYSWWPAGAHLTEMFGPRYAVIGSAVGMSEANGIGQPEAGTLEARLTAVPGPALFIPTHQGHGLPPSDIVALPIRSRSSRNPTYFPLTPQSVTDFDWLAVVDTTAYTRGGPPLHQGDAPLPQ
jgi:erythromycin esterase-like protein